MNVRNGVERKVERKPIRVQVTHGWETVSDRTKLREWAAAHAYFLLFCAVGFLVTWGVILAINFVAVVNGE